MKVAYQKHNCTIPFNLEAIDTSSTEAVAAAVIQMQQSIFPGEDSDYIRRRFCAIGAMFAGDYEGFQPMDTAYHDLEHTLQATLCLVRLITNRHRAGAQPRMTPKDFDIALIAILLHDVGYLKEDSDIDGTGAKYTHVHELRSCRHARAYLLQRSWPDITIRAVENLIRCTGPRSNLNSIPFGSAIERVLGQAVCTADFIGQMSDPKYCEKLPTLYREFVESYDYQELPPAERQFKSYNELLRKTPDFWEYFVKDKMTAECGSVWDYLADPESGENPYLDAVERNMARIREQVALLD